VHDFFDVLGLPDSAHPLEVRRVSARYVRRCHPDFSPRQSAEGATSVGPSRDAAVDYVDPLRFLDRIQAAFFATPR
jgi:hypothetical protein